MTDKAIQKGYTKRYLPEKAWASLSKEERAETEKKPDVPPVVINKVSNFIINKDT